LLPCTPAKLAALIGSLDRARLLELAQKARALGKPEATRTVAEHCMQLAGGDAGRKAA